MKRRPYTGPHAISSDRDTYNYRSSTGSASSSGSSAVSAPAGARRKKTKPLKKRSNNKVGSASPPPLPNKTSQMRNAFAKNEAQYLRMYNTWQDTGRRLDKQDIKKVLDSRQKNMTSAERSMYAMLSATEGGHNEDNEEYRYSDGDSAVSGLLLLAHSSS